jgi:lipopolysaccharide/colanic/teichoic acid biosynthesis glycosyltransferase
MINRMVKRLIDVVGSGVGLVILAPVLGVVAVAVKIGSPGPVLYRAKRVGQRGKLFHLYKFRSMRVNADKQGLGITTHNDSRVTPIGKILRRTKLDELPQLLNVFKGEMSLVGPRPEDPRYVELYTVEQRRVLEVKPGITSLATLEYRHEEALLTATDPEKQYIEQIMPAKLTIDLEYVTHATILTDLTILFKTVWAVLTK